MSVSGVGLEGTRRVDNQHTVADDPRPVNGLSIVCRDSEDAVTLHTLTLLHALCTAAMTGLVWFVQLVHYPLFARVGAEASRSYALEHQRRTTWLVGPLMVGELATAAALFVNLRGTAAEALTVAGLVLIAVIWFSTAAWQVPLHGQLARDPRPETVVRLVRTNWVRTVAWTARSVIALALVRAMMSSATGQ